MNKFVIAVEDKQHERCRKELIQKLVRPVKLSLIDREEIINMLLEMGSIFDIMQKQESVAHMNVVQFIVFKVKMRLNRKKG